MLKTVAKLVLGLILMLAIAVGSACLSYIITSNMIRKKTITRIENTITDTTDMKNAETLAVKKEKTDAEDILIRFEYYIVRLEGENLGVYAYNGTDEVFLYTEDIFAGDLSQDDLMLLRRGVKLKTLSAVTGFIENFTS